MATIEDLKAMYYYILGRQMNKLEVERVTEQVLFNLAAKSLDEIRDEMLISNEFMIRHKFQLLSKLLPPRATVSVLQVDGSEIYVDLRQQFIGWGILQGSYEPHESALIQRLVGAGMNVIDVGANVGYYTLMMAGLVGAHGVVDAVEPVQQNFELLEKSVNRNDYTARVHLHKAALMAREQEVQMQYHSGSTNMGGAHLRPDNVDSLPLHQNLVEEAVHATTLDLISQDRRINFVKIDVEGAEPLVIEGGRRMLLRDQPTILMEVNEAALRHISGVSPTWIFEMAADFDYDVYSIGESVNMSVPLDRSGLKALLADSGLCNVVFLRKDRKLGIGKSNAD